MGHLTDTLTIGSTKVNLELALKMVWCQQLLWEKHAQLPAVDMLKVQVSLWCYSNLSPLLIQPSLDAQLLCTLHSDCAKKSTYTNMWSLDGSLAGAW